MKWPSRACIALSMLMAALMVRSTFCTDDLRLFWKWGEFYLTSRNGQMEVEGDLFTRANAKKHMLYPTINYKHFPIVTDPMAKVGFALGDGFDHGYATSSTGRGLWLSFPHWFVVLLLLALPVGRWVIHRVRGPVESPRQR